MLEDNGCNQSSDAQINKPDDWKDKMLREGRGVEDAQVWTLSFDRGEESSSRCSATCQLLVNRVKQHLQGQQLSSDCLSRRKHPH
mmetsp:Transcript_13788/g.20936  ORF Transcript_13788/g.20936 Transcript_13788/m.20936 type:complete len:85 (-) Transcript_13788:123-377(-)